MAYQDFIKEKFEDIPEYYQNALKIGLAARKETEKDIINIKTNSSNFNKVTEECDIFTYLYAWTKNFSYAMYVDRGINICNSIPKDDYSLKDDLINTMKANIARGK